jgi:hypothetical protein
MFCFRQDKHTITRAATQIKTKPKGTMKNHVLAMFTCAVLAGCASQPASAPLASADLPPGEAAIALNVPGGQYMQFDTTFPNGPVEFTMRRANDDPKWAPMYGACARSASPSKLVCLKFHTNGQGGNEIVVTKEVLSEDSKALLSRQAIEGSYRVGETIRVDMLADGNGVRFRINGGKPITDTLDGAPTVARLLCSTAVCRFHIL